MAERDAPSGGKLVILDTDPGIDDAMALVHLAAAPEVTLHSVTTVFGNADVDTVTRNAHFLLDRFGLELPVFAGAAGPVHGPRQELELRVHGSDGFGDTGLARGFEPRSTSRKPAWQHIVDTLKARPGRISILAIGPLTNLALALRHDPDIAPLAAQIVVMGGAFGTQGRHGNIRPHAEANFFQDPTAADEVLAAAWPVTVVGLDVSTDCILPSHALRDLADGGAAGRLLWDISRGYEDIYRKYDGIDGCCIHDVAAAAYLCAPERFETARHPLCVERDGPEAGRSAVAIGRTRPDQRYCLGIDAEATVSDFVQSVIRFDASSKRDRCHAAR
ncbi:nucleoside hydrolase [Novosphingobium aquimarinum]|uniref:nucleoside hydrolase n=1 Tax=Novosphingobium aquimarinum TaxID=2682494 RepID=UPI0012ECABEE|nr:nucleoside hydrolase [Novosphingobium aquimarinum]